jgi:D-alanyl-D-alanine carboxypeptidase/Transglycosylase-like domain
MKKVLGVVVAAILALLIGLATIPYAIAIALNAIAQIDDNNCGVVFAAPTFTAEQVTKAYAPNPPPLEAKLIADALSGAALDLGPDFDEWFAGTRTIPIGPDKEASITDPKWPPLLSLRPVAGEDADREGPDVPEPFTPITAAEINTAFNNKPPAEANTISADLTTGFTVYAATIDAWFAGNGTLWIAGAPRSITDPIWAPLKTFDGRKPPAPPTPKSPPVTMNRVLATIRQLESTNNYQADTADGSASGAYQFTDGTWNNFRGYRRAVHAPPGIQDERAAIAVGAVLQKYGLEAVPISWYWPLALRDPTWMDRVPQPDYGNTLTVRQYQQNWLAAYTGVAAGTFGGGVGPCQPGGGGGDIGPVSSDSEQRSVSGSCTHTFTVHQSIAEPTQQMLNAACAEGVVFGGWGWRSPQEQINLRRAHCGPTHNDIYNKPSNQCSPPTARPGNSMHERGKAIDFNSGGVGLTRGSRGFRWLAINAKRYGWFNLPSEPWHWSENGR